MGFHPTTAYSDWQPYTAAGYNGVISVRRDSRYETFEELLAEVRANPDQITLAASSAGTVWHIQSELARQVGDVQFRFVSYPGSAPSQVAAISGEVEVVLTSIGEQRDLLLSGELRALAAFTAEPVEISGVGVVEPITDYVPELASYMPFSSFIGLAVPQDTPDDIKAAIEDAYLAAVDSDLFRNLIEGQLNGTVLGYDAAESSRFVQENTSVISWLLYDIELAANSPEDFDIPRP
ncbi:MAG: tripartite tricarboxylate transporter substrate-binding protein, partial [Deinococcota bacterium]|nr:tripartite tricarboxylate transporter substrate-binding protein [Deinococcota bacterium]